MDSLLYTLSETVHKQNYVIATYYTRLPREVDILKKAATRADHWNMDSDSWNYGGDSRKVYGEGGERI